MHILFVLFGATGDLAKRKLFSALYNIYSNQKDLSIDIIGVGRRAFDEEDFRTYVDKETAHFIEKRADFQTFLETLHYAELEAENESDYMALSEKILVLQKEGSEVIFYLAISPEYFPSFTKNYKHIALSDAKIIFEKPFGTNLQTARELNRNIKEVFQEEQIYRIDHYIGKEAIQNVLAFRFANTLFEAIWNNKYIDNIQITASESVGVGERGAYYDTAGALRDLVQNHLFQVLSLVVMDPPARLDALGIGQEKLKVFRSITLGEDFSDHIVFGQYSGYLDEKDVAEKSRTETFVAMKIEVDSWNFIGVPIYLRSGKALSKKNTRIVIEFKEIPNILFKTYGHIERNRIILEVQPNEGIDIHFNIKQDGSSHYVERVRSQFNKEVASKEAYEKLIEDVIIGDKTLFLSWDMLEESWRIVDDLINCKNNCPIIYDYEKGSNGPDMSYKLLEKDGRNWYE